MLKEIKTFLWEPTIILWALGTTPSEMSTSMQNKLYSPKCYEYIVFRYPQSHILCGDMLEEMRCLRKMTLDWVVVVASWTTSPTLPLSFTTGRFG